MSKEQQLYGVSMQQMQEMKLTDIIEQAAYSWTNARRDALKLAYNSAGQGTRWAADTVLKKCIGIIKDRNEAARDKINAIRILDACMDLQDCALGRAMVPQLKVFTQIAKKAKEQQVQFKRPPGIFSSRTPREEVADFMSAVCELLDKWGRRFKEQDAFRSKPELEEFNKARRDHILNCVPMPEPENYRFVEPYSVVDLSMSGGSPATAGELDEAVLNALVKEVQNLNARYGALDMRTADARARSESELRRWQDEAQRISESDDMDFAEFQRLSDVAHRNAAILENLPSMPEGGEDSAAALGGEVHQTASLESFDSAEGPASRRRRRQRKKSFDAFGQTGGMEQDSSAWASADFTSAPTPGFAPASDEWTAHTAGVDGFGPTGGEWHTQSGGFDRNAVASSGYDVGLGPADHGEWLPGSGEWAGGPKIPTLQAQASKLRMMIAECMPVDNDVNELEAALHRLRDLEAMQQLHSDYKKFAQN